MPIWLKIMKKVICEDFGDMLCRLIQYLKDSNEPFVATITANKETVEHTARMIVIANSQKYGTGVTINPNGR